ncbi:MAG: holo-ACP synthase [Acholeplasmataceae bacterium]|nr:holo-ACP synthase [Acholeplasmataceae bacterium]
MILGIGIDLVDLNRIKEIMTEKFIERVLSIEEQIVFNNIAAENMKLSYLGSRFAAKEAIFKAISQGPGKTNYVDFSILNHENGSPYIKTSFFKHNETLHISITHTDEHAIAYVMIEK